MNAFIPLPLLSKPGAALIASPNRALREQVLQHLNGRCRPVQQALGGAEALAKLEKGTWPLLFLDRRLPDLDAEELNTVIHKRFPDTEVVLLDSADAASGDNEKERDELESGRVRAPAPARARSASPVVPSAQPLPGMIGDSAIMQRVYRMVRLVAGRPTTVLITGATGTGKELVARALHELSPRAAKSFVVVNCAAIPEALLESELFGYTRGAFTGAVQSQLGRIQAAHGGTLFLDEVSELPLGMQAKLLRFLEQKEIQRLGTCAVTHVDVRVLAASNTDLAARAARGSFRQDLFYRLSAFPIALPGLAERRGDIVPLAEHFLACMALALETRAPHLSAEAISALEAHSWEGNVRELQHVMERASILSEGGDTIRPEHIYFSYVHAGQPEPLPESLDTSYLKQQPLA
ncbi:MAG TPA: sigma-54 dependent transcriptional regulator [Terriglobales bacterium]|nr:sigma-54 dependent transcriptional regulator [Terriglobales bacterium]